MNDPSVIVYFVIAYILKYYLNVKYVVEVRLHVFRGQNIAFETGHYLQKKNVLRDMFYFQAYNYENKIAVSAFIIYT